MSNELIQCLAGIKSSILLEHLYHWGYVQEEHGEHAREILAECYSTGLLKLPDIEQKKAE